MKATAATQSAPIKKLSGLPDVLADTELAPFAAEFDQVFARQGQIPFSQSYLKAQQFFLSRELEMLRRRVPEMPLRQVVTRLLERVPDNASPRLLLELTRFIIESWEEIPVEEELEVFA